MEWFNKILNAISNWWNEIEEPPLVIRSNKNHNILKPVEFNKQEEQELIKIEVDTSEIKKENAY